jgi:ATP-dependent DNA helicase RecG
MDSSDALTSEPTRAVTLSTPAQYLRGVGPQRAELLARLGIRTAGDLLFCFPRDYQHPAPRARIADLREDHQVSLVVTVVDWEQRATAAGKTVSGVLVEDESGSARLIYFNQPYRLEKLRRGMRCLVTGKARLQGLRFEFVHPQLVPLEEEEEAADGAILPVYPLTEGLKQSAMRRIVSRLVDQLAAVIPEVMPEPLRRRGGLPPIEQTLRAIHRPESPEALAAARRRLIYQELLVQQLALALRRRRLTMDLRSPPLGPTAEIDAAIRRRFPFTLTGDQRRAIDEVGRDMARQFPMNRLIQGDVGSGKTVVAQYAMLLTVAHRHQAVLMAPTDVLARQHLETFSRALRGSRVRIGLLSGSTPGSQRRQTVAAAAAGEIDLLIGTQALLYDGIELPQLGLVVIDEQHKFGVHQRARLRGDGLDPHYLVMSATPIPRTLAMTLFGDLEVSTLREKPPGRGVVKTYLAKADWRARWWQFVAEQLREGRQAYVVAPLVRGSADEGRSAARAAHGDTPEDAEASREISSAESVYAELRGGPLAEFRVGLLHGRLSAEEKHEVMRRFAQGRLQVLVATTVIEVGIDVPNATVMTILGAERFGLAQLHQLRGRVSRGKHVGHVGIFTDGPQSPQENQRLQVLGETDDGFELAEADLRMRGPGDLLGTRQSGLPPLRIADPLRDLDVLIEARQLAQEILEEDPSLEASELAGLKSQAVRRYGAVLDLGDVA